MNFITQKFKIKRCLTTLEIDHTIPESGACNHLKKEGAGSPTAHHLQNHRTVQHREWWWDQKNEVGSSGPILEQSCTSTCNRGARPRLGRKTYWHKDKAMLIGTRNYIILLLKSQQGWT